MRNQQKELEDEHKKQQDTFQELQSAAAEKARLESELAQLRSQASGSSAGQINRGPPGTFPIYIRNINNNKEKFVVHVSTNETVASLKQKVAEEKWISYH